MNTYMFKIYNTCSILIEGIAGTFLVWFIHSLSLWFLFDTANLQANVMEFLKFTEEIMKILSTVAITYWTYKGITKTVTKKKE
jgi:hypothetical protein